MAVSNRNTQQTPLANQTIKLILAERVYVAPTGQTYDHTDPDKYENTVPPAPWVDMGVVEGSKVTITYNKDIAYIETGIDKIRRGSYLRGKNANAKFTLTQVDDIVLTNLGIGTDAIAGTHPGHKFYVGQEDVVDKSMLFVGTNKIDGKEHQTYCESASLSFAYVDIEDARGLEVTAELSAFTPFGETVDALYVLFILD